MPGSVFELGLDNEDYVEGLEEAVEATEVSFRQVRRITNQIAGAWGQVFDFLKQGTGETAQQLRTLEASMESLQTKFATAAGETGAVRTATRGLMELSKASNDSSLGINTLANAMINLAHPAGMAANAITNFYDAFSGNIVDREIQRLHALRYALLTAHATGAGLAAVAGGLRSRAGAAALGGQASGAIPGGVVSRGGGGGGAGGGDTGPDDSMEVGTFLFGPGSTEEEEPFDDRPARRVNSNWGSYRKAIEDHNEHLQKLNEERVEHDRKLFETEKGLWQARTQLSRNYVDALAQSASMAADAAGAGATAQHLIEATSEGIKAGIAWAAAANPFGGEAFIPEAILHTTMFGMALKAAAAPASPQAPPGGGGGGGGRGGGAPRGSAAAGMGGGGGGFQGTIVLQMPNGFFIGGRRELQRTLTDMLGAAADNGIQIPIRALPERRR